VLVSHPILTHRGRLDDLTEWAHGFTGRAQSFPGYRAWSPAGWWSFGPAASWPRRG